MKKRQGYILLGSFVNKKTIDGKILCLNCEGIITEKRRYRYCSWDCSSEWLTKHDHKRLRSQLIMQKDNLCDDCNEVFSSTSLILDHIKPIALGGDEFDKTNLQILCTVCNKVKTKQDLKDIAKLRAKEKILSDGQRQLKTSCNIAYTKEKGDVK